MPDDLPELDRIRVRYATFRDHDGSERVALATRLRAIPADEMVLLETCHRIELVAVGPEEGAAADTAVAAGRAAVRRVFEVVAGFDSAVMADEQLLGQARQAYEGALAQGATGPVLNELFRRALRLGRRVRSHAQPGTDRSLADPGLSWLVEHVPAHGSVVVAGTGEMGRIMATRLAGRGHPLTVVSGSEERGRRLIEQLPPGDHRLRVGAMTADLLAQTDALALAVRTREPVLTAAMLTAGRLPWTLDLSTPPAVDRDAGALLGERLLAIDRLGEMAGARPVLAPDVERRLRDELEREVEAFGAWLATRRGAEALELLHGEAEAVRRRHLERLRRRAGLDESQLAAVDAAARAMVGELLHGPSVELRRGGADAATVRRLFGLEA